MKITKLLVWSIAALVLTLLAWEDAEAGPAAGAVVEIDAEEQALLDDYEAVITGSWHGGVFFSGVCGFVVPQETLDACDPPLTAYERTELVARYTAEWEQARDQACAELVATKAALESKLDSYDRASISMHGPDPVTSLVQRQYRLRMNRRRAELIADGYSTLESIVDEAIKAMKAAERWVKDPCRMRNAL